ncbi:hypothetical protein NLI96_g3513 [Meripilus lineatus]|uniref:PH domain-containing protein n=1 Tax=Meripilus lineatus TaxID=2056292 RepID=A0AAD5YFL0_9APHY|nr:hypothetical protein NLI96_g3513 [Physisporinus lineatus]
MASSDPLERTPRSKPPPPYLRDLLKGPHIPSEPSKPSFVASENFRIAFVDYTPEDASLDSPFQVGSYPRLDSEGPGDSDDYLAFAALSTTTPSQNSYSPQLTPPEEPTTQTPEQYSTGQHPLSPGEYPTITMVKKRRSLQSIFIPPFFQPTSLTEASPNRATRLRSHSAAATTTSHYPLPPPIPINSGQPISVPSSLTSPRNSPPSDLLDDDPFANLNPGPSVINHTSNRARSRSLALPRLTTSLGSPSEPPPPTPRSPLSQPAVPGPSFSQSLGYTAPVAQSDIVPSPPPSSIQEKKSRSLRGPWSPGQGQARPAHTRPAFRSRPSLPSLRSLAEGQVVTPRVRRGRVGARLPSEPWDSQGSDLSTSESEASESPSPRPSHFRRPSNLETIRDSRFYNAAGDPTDELVEQLPEPVLEEPSSPVPPPSVPPHENVSSFERSYQGRAGVPQLLRARSEPYPSSRHAMDLSSHSREFTSETVSSSGSSSSSGSAFSAPSLTTSPESLVPCDASYSTIFSHRRTARSIDTELESNLEYDYTDTLMSLNSSPDLDAIGYTDPSITDGFQPGSSADTIRSVPIHQRSMSNLSETIDWAPTMSGLPLSPTSTSSSSRSSGGPPSYEASSSEEYGVGYGRDFMSMHSDSSEEHLPSPSLSRSSSLGGERRTSSFSTRSYGFFSLRAPHNSLYDIEDEGSFEIDDDVSDQDSTERVSTLFSLDEETLVQDSSVEEAVDGGEGSGRRGDVSQYNGHSSGYGDQGRWNGGSNGGGGSSWGGGGGYGNGSGGGRRGNDGDDRWNRRPTGRTNVSASKDSDTSEDEETDKFGQASPRSGRRAKQASDSAASTDDDVPLAQQIPTALRASEDHPSSDKSPHAADQAEVPASPRPTTRPRTKTLPSKPTSPFILKDLTAKLLDVQAGGSSGGSSGSRSRRPSAEHLPPPVTPLRQFASPSRPSFENSPRQSKSQNPLLDPTVGFPRSPAADTYGSDAVRARTLRPSKSFHRPRTANGEIEHLVPPVPIDPVVKLSRSATTVGKRPHELQPLSSPLFSPFSPVHKDDERPRMDRSKSTRSTSRGPSFDRSRRPSYEQDNHRPPLPKHPSADRSPVPPPLPTPKPEPTWTQRIFVGSLQTFCQVEVKASTTAGDLLRLLESQSVFPDGSRRGWMMFEVCQDFGMERPIRSLELLTHISSSWNSDKTVNAFMAKKTNLAHTLSSKLVPSSSPMCHGQIQYEHKRGKWQKRYLELREHGLWLAKKDTGKDQVFLCSLQNFDAYLVTRVYKSPKSFVFAVKSTDNLSYFENTDDYMHVFSCETRDGINWLEKILLARSYILYQERNVLTTAHATPSAMTSGISQGASLSRAGTRKHQRPVQPLLNFASASSAADAPPPQVFEPGSLLGKRA